MRTSRTKSLTRSVIQRSQFEGMGSNPVDHTERDGWQIEVSQRKVGLTVRREQFCATIRHVELAHEEYLSGFSTREQARNAALHRVDLLIRQPELLRRGGKRRRSVLPNSETWQREITNSIPKLP